MHGDIGDRALLERLLAEHEPRAVVHFAAESHVDRSIHGPAAFVQTNVVGTFELLEAARAYWQGLDPGRRAAFRFLHVSTDEVYGSLGPNDAPSPRPRRTRRTAPTPRRRPGSDHLVRAYHHTYGLPTVTTNCSNNYGPYQFPEKLIPLMILNALEGKPLPVYGDGQNVRDWLYVGDHCEAIRAGARARRGRARPTTSAATPSGATSTWCTRCATRCRRFARARAATGASSRRSPTGPGTTGATRSTRPRSARELGWTPRETFETGLAKTVRWYLDHAAWVAQVKSGEYRQWLEVNYAARSAS